MAKKKAKPCSKKTCGKKCNKKLSCNDIVQPKIESPKMAKAVTKSEYFLGLIKKAFGYD